MTRTMRRQVPASAQRPADYPSDGSLSVRPYQRVGAAFGILGPLCLVAGTALHPVPADVNDAAAAFASYAAISRPTWVTAHLLQLLGIASMVLAMVLIARAVTGGGASALWARMTAVCGAAAIAVTATLQAVDGVALKAMVDLWSHGSTADRPALFAAAQAVRQVEIGLDGVFSLTLAAAALSFGLVLLLGATRRRRLLGALAVLTAATAAVGGVLFCLHGFSPAAMNAGTASGVLGMVLTAATGLWAGPGNKAHRRDLPRPHPQDASAKSR